jgi:FixJ family two-component response regulator
MSEVPLVYVVDDDEGMRNSICFVLNKADIPCREFGDSESFLTAMREEQPVCLVIDFHMPQLSGLALIQEVRQAGENVPFVLVTGYGTVGMAVEAMKLGAITVIEKPFSPEQLIEAVRSAICLDQRRREESQQEAELTNRMNRLTAREREIAKLVADGNLTKQIAKSLGISTKTVEVHRSHITKKLGVTSVAQLVKMVIQKPVDPR